MKRLIDIFKDITKDTDYSFYYEHWDEFVNDIQSKGQSGLVRFPAILLMPEVIEKVNSYHFTNVDCVVRIFDVTNPNLTTIQRDEQIFETKLFVIKDWLIEQLQARYDILNQLNNGLVEYEMSKIYSNGTDADVINTYVDGIELKIKDLKLINKL